MEKEAALAASLEALDILGNQLKVLIDIKSLKETYYQDLVNKKCNPAV